MNNKHQIVNEIVDLLDEAIDKLNVKDCDYVFAKVKEYIEDSEN